MLLEILLLAVVQYLTGIYRVVFINDESNNRKSKSDSTALGRKRKNEKIVS